MSKPHKRPYADQPLNSHTAKKRKPNNSGNGNTSVPTAPETITSSRQIYVLLTDLSSPQALQKGYQSFRNFLQRCMPDRSGPGANGDEEKRSETDVVRNKAILREWVESEAQGGRDEKQKGKKGGQKTAKQEGEQEVESEQWTTVAQGLGFASQSGNYYLLSAVASALALLVRTVSTIPELSTHGTGLCKALLEPANIKLTIRGITSHQDRVASPMLRLLTEINKFNLGEFCNILYSSIDFSTKDLGKNLEPKKTSASTASGEIPKEDPSKPTLRTVYIRFILSFFHYGTPTVKQGLLSQRNLITPVFKHIKLDNSQIIHDFLETLKTKVVNDALVPRAIKSQVFNEWVLGHISALYSRPEPINEFGDQSKTVARAAHDFLIALCTKPGVGGVCFPDNGWYPPVVTGGGKADEEKRAGGRVFNRTLAAFVTTLKPSSDTLQQDLLLQIFTAAPELVAPYFTSPSSSAYPFDPKLSATWIGYCAFLTLLVQLPLPKGGFGLEGNNSEVAQLSPPPILVVLESVLPKVCTRQVLTKCLSYENALARYLGIRFMVAAFQKLSIVTAAMENVARQFPDGSTSAGRWLLARGELIEEFSRRAPELGPVVTAYNSAPVIKTGGGLAREAVAKLLMQYYTLLPEVSLGKRFDVNIALGSFLEDKEGGEVKGLRLLEMEHLLGVAKEAGDVKWWSKAAGAPYSSFTMVMRLCIPALTGSAETNESSLSSSSSSRQVKAVLRAALDQTHIFQQGTAVDPFDALLESMATVRTASPLEAFNVILAFVDDCMVRCVRTPFKYLDEVGSLITFNSGHVQLPLSPLVISLTEQLSFVCLSKDMPENVKKEVIMWVARFFENLRLAGENGNAIAEVGRKLLSSLKKNEPGFPLMKLLQTCDGVQSTWYNQDQTFKAQTGTIYPPATPVLCVRSIFPTLKDVDSEMLDKVLEVVEEGEMGITTFEISLLLYGIGILVNSHDHQHLDKILDVLEYMILRVKGSDGEDGELSKVKTLVAGRGSEILLSSLISGKFGESFEKRYTEILTLLFENGYEESLQPLVGKITNFLSALDPSIDDVSISSRIPRFERLISKFVPTQMLEETMSTVLDSALQNGKLVTYEVLVTVLKCVVERVVTLDVDTLSGLLAIVWKTTDNDTTKNLLDVLGNYLAQVTEIPLLESAITRVMEEGASPERIEKLARQRPEIIGLLLGKVDSVRRLVLECLNRQTREELGIHTIIILLKASLESLTIPTTKGYIWKDTADTETKTILRQVLENWIQDFKAPEILRNHPEMLGVFSRMMVLFPQIDMGDILKHILRDTQRSNVTPETVSFVSSLLNSNDKAAKDGESAAVKKGWLLMMVDNLTRRFGEEKILSEKSTHLAKEFAELLKGNSIVLSDWVPRASLNALLEAAVEKKIGVEEVLELVGVVVNRADVKSLDLAKVLQMILGNSKNPLAFREGGTEMIHYYAAWLIYKLFTLKKEVNSNISTLDGVLVLYRGTCSVVDKLLLEVMVAIEGHLTQSCASRISTWSFLGDRNDASLSSSTVLISRQKGSLAVTIDEELLTTSVAQYSPEGANKLDQEKVGDWEQYLEIMHAENDRLVKQYDHTFMLPVLGYLVASKGKDLGSGQTMVEKGAVGYTIMGLSSSETNIRTTAMQVLSGIISRLEDSVYRARNQINHLLCALLASLESDHKGIHRSKTGTGGGSVYTIDNSPLPTIVTVFLAHSTQQVLPDPGHFYYEPIMEMLLRSPLLDIWDIPHLLSSSPLGSEDEHFYKVVNWKLNTLSCGLRSEIDLNLYRKRRVFESVLAMYMNPYAGEKTKTKIVDLLWNLAEVKGGGMTAVTRNGVVAWVRGLVDNVKGDLVVRGNNAADRERENEKVVWKVVVGRLVEMADRKHLKEWGRGGLGPWVDEIYTT